MKSLRELLSEQRFEILDGRTPAENAAEWVERWKAGKGRVFPRGPLDKPAPLGQQQFADPADLPLHLDRCGVPARIAGALTALEERPEVVAVRNWMQGEKTLAILTGDPGAGKSVAAASAFLQAKRLVTWDGGSYESWDSARCAFYTAAELASDVFSDEGKKTFVFLANAQLVVLDDLGIEYANDAWRSGLEELLDARFKSHRKTVITTNISARRKNHFTPSPLEERYGARIARRIRESSEIIVFKSAKDKANPEDRT